MGLLKEDPVSCPNIYTVNPFPSLFQREQLSFIRVTVHWGKINNQNFWRLVDTGSELTLNPEDKIHPCGSLLSRGLKRLDNQ